MIGGNNPNVRMRPNIRIRKFGRYSEIRADSVIRIRSDGGFTLMELLVVVAIFSTVTVAATDIYLIATRAQRRVVGNERIAGVARGIVERIARDVRTGRIDYAAYVGGTIPFPAQELALRDESGGSVRYRFTTDPTSCAGAGVSCITITEGTDSARLTQETILVRELTFLVNPSVDPFALDPSTGGYASNESPRVTIILSIQDTATPGASPVTVQTTVVSRTYVR